MKNNASPLVPLSEVAVPIQRPVAVNLDPFICQASAARNALLPYILDRAFQGAL